MPHRVRLLALLLLAPLLTLLAGCGGGGGNGRGPGGTGGVAFHCPAPQTRGWNGLRARLLDASGRPTAEAAAAARFLGQATFGPRQGDIVALLDDGLDYGAWIDRQLALPATRHRPLMAGDGRDERLLAWWQAVVHGEDQLRQRMAWALSQLFVVSDRPDLLFNNQPAMADYYDLLVTHAFGNFRDLLGAVTRHLVMGEYLSLKSSSKADPDTGQHPDENYAREVMQLFTIGLVQLAPDGTVRTDADGAPLPTYRQADIEALARTLSGWSSANGWLWRYDWFRPMIPYPEHHDSGEKRFLGHTIPAGQTPEQDMEQALDILFNHPNTGPFVARRLIQRFTASNPSPAYVARVAAVFADNGQGVRGDLAAVLRAVLLDPEARQPGTAPGSGKLREPLLRVAQLWRAFDACIEGHDYWRPYKDLLQAPLSAPSVFNFYSPGYRPPDLGGDPALVAPEFQIVTDASLTTSANKLFRMALGGYWNSEYELDVTPLLGLADDPPALLGTLDLLLMSGDMPATMRQALLTYLDGPAPADPEERVRGLIYLILTSAQYAVQR